MSLTPPATATATRSPLLLYLTVGGFMLEQFTLPGVLPDGLLEKVIPRIVGAGS
ncbi:hypothetical protein EV646_10472 [Kribbella antiqua]|uniref:Uncharacterized protein n=1 Tax=Kribbella antiqua TaxID=2512217 RepID=A0A4R2IZ22_9ACTN|nr:hypothetical protein [Kribbella antiqua]TCO48255.1 hypothetical protein EV646_10472 [Kribbella antiqua]